MQKAFSVILASVLMCGMASVVSAEDSVAALNGEEINLGQAAAEYIKGSEEMPIGVPADGFDGDMATIINYGVEGGEEYWFGVRFDQPTILTSVTFTAPDRNSDGTHDRKHCLHGCVVDGFNDGVN